MTSSLLSWTESGEELESLSMGSDSVLLSSLMLITPATSVPCRGCFGCRPRGLPAGERSIKPWVRQQRGGNVWTTLLVCNTTHVSSCSPLLFLSSASLTESVCGPETETHPWGTHKHVIVLRQKKCFCVIANGLRMWFLSNITRRFQNDTWTVRWPHSHKYLENFLSLWNCKSTSLERSSHKVLYFRKISMMPKIHLLSSRHKSVQASIVFVEDFSCSSLTCWLQPYHNTLREKKKRV